MKAAEFVCKVESFRMLTPTVFEITFNTDRLLHFQGGQFISIIIPGAGPNGRDLRRAYSIASSPERDSFELCIKVVEGGPGTQYLYKLRPGDAFRGIAPYGDFIYKPKLGRHACFIATGTGIAPFRSILLSQNYRSNPPVKASCLLGVRTEAELLYDLELRNFSGLNFITAVSQGTESNGKDFNGRVTHYLQHLGDNFPWLETEYYLCGHGGMITEVKALLTKKGVSKNSLHQEVYYK